MHTVTKQDRQVNEGLPGSRKWFSFYPARSPVSLLWPCNRLRRRLCSGSCIKLLKYVSQIKSEIKSIWWWIYSWCKSSFWAVFQSNFLPITSDKSVNWLSNTDWKIRARGVPQPGLVQSSPSQYLRSVKSKHVLWRKNQKNAPFENQFKGFRAFLQLHML